MPWPSAGGLGKEIDAHRHRLKVPRPCHESAHGLNCACHILAGGGRWENLARRRPHAHHRNGGGAQWIPDPTTAGDCPRQRVGSQPPQGFLAAAGAEVDGMIAVTTVS